MLGISVFGREVAVGKIDPGCIGDDLGVGRVDDAEEVHGLRVGRIFGAGESATQALFEKLIFIFGGDVSVHDLRAWRSKASVVYGGEGGYVGCGAGAEDEVGVGGHPDVRLTGPVFGKHSDRFCRRPVADGSGEG